MQNKEVFLALVRAGLWGKSNDYVKLNENLFEDFDWDVVQKLAEEQLVFGLVAAGAEKLTAYSLPLTEKLTLLGKCQLIEQQNEAMNRFIAELIARVNKNGIYALLVKGQGIAQCYEKPLWRSTGDIDLLLDEENYNKAKAFLSPLSEKTVVEDYDKKHLSTQLSGFTIELHGRMPFVLSRRADRVIDEVIADSLLGIGGKHPSVRVWKNGNTNAYLPNADNDVILVFTHYLHHFFIEGVGSKQICDWCRLLWTYRDEIDRPLLESRLRSMGLMSEWKAFASLAVNRLGMPVEAMPFYDDSPSFRRKANKVLRRIMKSGNLGHNNDVSYRARHSAIIANVITFFRRMADFAKLTLAFPKDSPAFFMRYVLQRIKR